MRLDACAVGNGLDGSGATPRGNESEPMIKTRGHERPRSTTPRTTPLLLTHLDPAEEILVCLISFLIPPPDNYTSRSLRAFEVNIGLSFISHVIHSSFSPSRPSPSILRLCDQEVEPLGFLSAIGKVSESLAQTHKLYSR